MYEMIETLRDVGRRCQANEPPSPKQSHRLGASLARFLDHRCRSVQEALGFRFPQGGAPWRHEEAIRKRNATLRELAARFFGGLSTRAQAQRVWTLATRCAPSTWRHDRKREGTVLHVRERIGAFPLVAVLSMALAACSVKQTAVNILGDALAGGGGVYTSDDDPELIREAIPFGLKTYESLLEVSPEHRGLLLAAANGFTGYAYLLQGEADQLDATDVARARELRARASKLYLRGRDYALRELDVAHRGFTAELRRDATAALAETTAEDVPYLYWAGAAWAGALSAAKDDLDLIAELPIAGALVGRVLELDETYEAGAAHEFFISYEGGRPGGSVEEARRHYRRAVELSEGLRASVHLALAEAVTVAEQNLAEFRSLIAAALAVDPHETPELRLVNTIARRRALWLQSRIPQLFVDTDLKKEPIS